MNISALDFFIAGPGPFSEHSVRPMVAARHFAEALAGQGLAERVARIHAHLHGSFASVDAMEPVRSAVMLGLQGERPELVEAAQAHLAGIRTMCSLRLACGRVIAFDERTDFITHRQDASDGIRLTARDAEGGVVMERHFTFTPTLGRNVRALPFRTGRELVRLARESGRDICALILQHESTLRPEAETRARLLESWQIMAQSIQNGCEREDEWAVDSPGPFRAAWLNRELNSTQMASLRDPLSALDWVSLWAIAVSEENAAGGRVVAVPDNETCGILPAVLNYLIQMRDGADEERILRFLLTASAVATLCAAPASAAGVETSLGCAMASAALCDALGGTTEQVVTAAALGLESHRGSRFSTSEYPAIGEPNAIAAVTAINTARIARRTLQPDVGLLDRVITGLQPMTRARLSHPVFSSHPNAVGF
jgi:L-serine dehydratase